LRRCAQIRDLPNSLQESGFSDDRERLRCSVRSAIFGLVVGRRPQKMPFNSLAETLTYIKVVDGLGAKAAIATAGFAGLKVSELQGLDWKDRYDGQWHVARKVVEGRTGHTKTAARQECVPIIPYLERSPTNIGRIWDAPPKDRFLADG